MKTMLIYCGDKRMEYCAERLSGRFSVTSVKSGSPPAWELGSADILVLPYLSLSGQYLNAPDLPGKIPAVSALDKLRYGGVLFGGGLDPGFLSYCEEKAVTVFDFFDFEELTLKNAALTAEGALERIIKNTPVAVDGMNVLIVGFGRVARACAEKLSLLGANILVAVRSEKARDEAVALGYSASPLFNEVHLSLADAVVNTVPQRVLDGHALAAISRGAYVLDLASKPYGADPEFAASLGLKYETAPGLPGKVAPKTAGEMIAETVIKLCEGGEADG